MTSDNIWSSVRHSQIHDGRDMIVQKTLRLHHPEPHYLRQANGRNRNDDADGSGTRRKQRSSSRSHRCLLLHSNVSMPFIQHDIISVTLPLNIGLAIIVGGAIDISPSLHSSMLSEGMHNWMVAFCGCRTPISKYSSSLEKPQQQ